MNGAIRRDRYGTLLPHPAFRSGIPAVRERDVLAACLDALNAIPGVYAHRNNIGAVERDARRIRYGVGGTGAPDLLCEVRTLAGWIAVWIECKRPGASLAPNQRVWRMRAEADGRHVGTAWSADDAVRIVLEFQRRTNARVIVATTKATAG